MYGLWKNSRLKAVNFCFILVAGFITVSVNAAPYSITRYIKIDPQEQSAYVYDDSFIALPENPYVPNSSIDVLPEGEISWYLGAKIDVIRKNPDSSISVVSADPRYYEMNHHIVWAYVSDNKRLTDECGANRPLAAGSELTDLRWPSGYGYKMQGGALFPASWHWENPANLPVAEEVYLRFIIQYDNNPDAYTDTHVSWIDTVPCSSTFKVPRGTFNKIGPDFPVREKSRIVAVIPHLHDHAKKLTLKRNGKNLRVFRPANANIPVAHNDVGNGPTRWHKNPQHLPSEGLQAWSPGVHGPVLKAGDVLKVHSIFFSPHKKMIDNMAISVIIWESLE